MHHFNIVPVPKPTFTRVGKRLIVRENVKRYWSYKEQLQSLLKGVEITPHFDVFFIMPMPKSWSKKKKRAYDGQPHQQKPDRDNLLKAFQDALLIEDKHIFLGRLGKFWGYEGQIVLILYDTIPTLAEVLSE